MNSNFEGGLKGLTTTQANIELNLNGLNEIKTSKFSWLVCLLSQFKSPITYLLIFSALLSFFTGGLFDALVILVIVLINVFIGFHQELKASNLAETLKSFITKQTLVLRDDKESFIDSKYLVKGDIIKLKLGDIIPADATILQFNNLKIDESAITGESIGIEKIIGETLFSGSNIQSGTATCKVIATGSRSEFGQVSNLALNTVKKSEFGKSMSNLSTGFLIVGIAYFGIIFSLQIILGRQESLTSSLLFILALTVSIVPEALPVITSLSLASKSVKLAKKGLIVKYQTTLEDLGNIDILCSDKTGTLTENKLTIQEFAPNKNQSSDEFIKIVCDLAIGGNDILDKSALDYIQTNKIKIEANNYELIPFDPALKYSGKKYNQFTVVRGAPEQILELCANEIGKITYLKEIETQEQNGLKSICYALKQNNENIFKYLGTVYYADQIKENTAELIQKCKKLDLELKIITGDSLAVSQYVGIKSGLIKLNSETIAASELNFDDLEILKLQVKSHSIFARCNPIQKYKIIEILQKNYVVGYLGDGINDAPSLKLAQVGIVVDTASDIAKSSADIIMTRNNLEVIMTGVEEGRKVYENINKYIKQSLSGNFGNFFTLGLFSLILSFPPILGIQVLICNLITDLPLISVAFDNVKKSEIRKPKHQNIKRLLLMTFVLGLVSSLFDFIFFAFNRNLPVGQIQTSWFTFSILTELVLLFSIRTKLPFWKGAKLKLNMIIMTLVAGVVTLLFSTNLFGYLNIAVIDLSQFLSIVLLVGFYFVASEVVKVLYYKYYGVEVD